LVSRRGQGGDKKGGETYSGRRRHYLLGSRGDIEPFRGRRKRENFLARKNLRGEGGGGSAGNLAPTYCLEYC